MAHFELFTMIYYLRLKCKATWQVAVIYKGNRNYSTVRLEIVWKSKRFKRAEKIEDELPDA